MTYFKALQSTHMLLGEVNFTCVNIYIKIRLTKTVGYLLLTVHIYACIYYAVSARQGFGSDFWVYDGEGNRLDYTAVTCNDTCLGIIQSTRKNVEH